MDWHNLQQRWWREHDRPLLIAEKIYIESPMFNGECIVEDVHEDTHTITYTMVSVPKHPLPCGYEYLPVDDL